jgi:hypothetical protein
VLAGGHGFRAAIAVEGIEIEGFQGLFEVARHGRVGSRSGPRRLRGRSQNGPHDDRAAFARAHAIVDVTATARRIPDKVSILGLEPPLPAPAAYRDIREVIEDQVDLVERVWRLEPRLVLKG